MFRKVLVDLNEAVDLLKGIKSLNMRVVCNELNKTIEEADKVYNVLALAKCKCSLENGVLTLEDGTQIKLV